MAHLCHILHDAVFLNELNRKALRISLPAVQQNVQGVALGVPGAPRLVQHVLGHLSPGRPLAPGDEGHPRVRILRDDVISRHLSPRGRVGVSRERPPSPPRAQHVRSPDLDVLRQVLFTLLKHPLDLFLGGIGEGLGIALVVGRADEDGPLPGEEEEEPAIGGVVVEQPHVVRGVVAREDDVGAGRALDGGLDGRLVLGLLLAERIGEGAAGEDDVLGVNLKCVAGDAIHRLDADDLAILVEDALRHFN